MSAGAGGTRRQASVSLPPTGAGVGSAHAHVHECDGTRVCEHAYVHMQRGPGREALHTETAAGQTQGGKAGVPLAPRTGAGMCGAGGVECARGCQRQGPAGTRAVQVCCASGGHRAGHTLRGVGAVL